MTVTLILIVILVAAVVQVYCSIHAKATWHVHTALSPDEARTIATRAFRRGIWTNSGGPGEINKRMHFPGPFSKPMISADAQGSDDGGSIVDLWMSEYSHTLGVANYALFALLMKRRAARKLHEAAAMRTLPANAD